MKARRLAGELAAVIERARGLGGGALGDWGEAGVRWEIEATALARHLRGRRGSAVLALLGGTGVGKSTLLNRLVGSELCAASIRRTFTSGLVAVAGGELDDELGGLPHRQADGLPARGEAATVTVVRFVHRLTREWVLLDAPDVDGEEPAHHLLAYRAFVHADAVLFLVTPEKYQTPALWEYYQRARRWGLPHAMVVNKLESEAVVSDYRGLLSARLGDAGGEGAPIFAVARDGSGFVCEGLGQMEAWLAAPPAGEIDSWQRGLSVRVGELVGDLRAGVIEPARRRRAEVDGVVGRLKEMRDAVGAPRVDVHPLARPLEQAMRQQSIAHVLAPSSIVREGLGLLGRLPWLGRVLHSPERTPDAPPDIAAQVREEFGRFQLRLDDILRRSGVADWWAPGQKWRLLLGADLDRDEASDLARLRVDDLSDWLARHEQGAPRDTALLRKLLGRWRADVTAQRAPYVLMATAAILVAATPVSLLGAALALVGWEAASRVGARLANPVPAEVARINRQILDDFVGLARRQIEAVITALEARCPASAAIEGLEKAAGALLKG